jgi:hypothetical protein
MKVRIICDIHRSHSYKNKIIYGPVKSFNELNNKLDKSIQNSKYTYMVYVTRNFENSQYTSKCMAMVKEHLPSL